MADTTAEHADSPRVEKLLDVATEAFSQNGLAGARVDAIARSSGSNKQLVYYYFESKLGLWAAVLRRTIGRTAELWLDAEPTATLGDRLVFTGHRIGSAGGAHWRRLLAWEALESGGENIVLKDERLRTWGGQVAETREAQERGEIDPELDAEILTLAIFSMQMLPHVLPQVTRLVTGLSPGGPAFQRRLDATLRELAERLKPRA
jgi:AcrR family transcriptional regulator